MCAGKVTGEGEYAANAVVSVEATANPLYTFLRWIDEDNNIISTDASFNYTMPSTNVTLTAVFEAKVGPGQIYNVEKEESYNEIQAAIDDADAGNTLLVGEGTYEENININKTLTLYGIKAYCDPRESQGGRTGAESIIDGLNGLDPVGISADDVVLNGFTIYRGTRGGISSADKSGSVIVYNRFRMNGTSTTDAYSFSGRKVSNVLFQYNDLDGAPYSSRENYGFYAWDMPGNVDHEIKDNDFRNYKGVGARGHAIYLRASPGMGVTTGHVISGNHITDVGTAMQLESLADTEVSGNHIYNSWGTRGYGLYIWGRFAGSTENLEIVGNSIHDTRKAIRVKDMWDEDTSFIRENNIYDNIEYGLSSNVATVDATHNWWGAANGPGGEGPGDGDDVSENVLFDPWADSPF